MRQENISIVFAGGGTGGHLFPAIAIASEVRRNVPNAQITFIGTRHKIEARIVPGKGFGFEAIWVSGLKRRWTPENALFPVKFIVSIVQSLFLMWKLKPDVVVGTGGYVCGPPVFAAQMLGIPTLIQEQNSYPGVTTRLLASRASEVHLSFDGSRQYLRRLDNVRVSGNPTREEVGKIPRETGAAYFGVDPEKKTLLVFGGSLGATSINRVLLRVLPKLVASSTQVIWQTGELDYEKIKAEVDEIVGNVHGRVCISKFIDNMEFAYAACDLAVCRAGATTVAELAKAAVPSVLVPYPYAAADHQTENAAAMVKAGAAVMIGDAELDERLLTTIEALLGNQAQLQDLRKKATHVGNPDATAVLARAVVRLAGVKDGRA